MSPFVPRVDGSSVRRSLKQLRQDSQSGWLLVPSPMIQRALVPEGILAVPSSPRDRLAGRRSQGVRVTVPTLDP